MIEIIGTTEQAKFPLSDTAIGTCNYTAVYWAVTQEVLHTAVNMSGKVVQWVTPAAEFSMINVQESAIAKIAELTPPVPVPEHELPEPPAPPVW